ncbi:MAG: hypothetical protein ACRDOE_14500, partial [Streptosporangiaceae bacterium]
MASASRFGRRIEPVQIPGRYPGVRAHHDHLARGSPVDAHLDDTAPGPGGTAGDCGAAWECVHPGGEEARRRVGTADPHTVT